MLTTGWDKSNHVLAFATLAFLAHNAWPHRIWLMLSSLVSYGVLIEIIQTFTPDRHGEWSDLGADGLGLLIGQVVVRLGGWLARRWARC